MTEPAATFYYVVDFRWSVHANLTTHNATQALHPVKMLLLCLIHPA